MCIPWGACIVSEHAPLPPPCCRLRGERGGNGRKRRTAGPTAYVSPEVDDSTAPPSPLHTHTHAHTHTNHTPRLKWCLYNNTERIPQEHLWVVKGRSDVGGFWKIMCCSCSPLLHVVACQDYKCFECTTQTTITQEYFRHQEEYI